MNGSTDYGYVNFTKSYRLRNNTEVDPIAELPGPTRGNTDSRAAATSNKRCFKLGMGCFNGYKWPYMKFNIRPYMGYMGYMN